MGEQFEYIARWQMSRFANRVNRGRNETPHLDSGCWRC